MLLLNSQNHKKNRSAENGTHFMILCMLFQYHLIREVSNVITSNISSTNLSFNFEGYRYILYFWIEHYICVTFVTFPPFSLFSFLTLSLSLYLSHDLNLTRMLVFLSHWNMSCTCVFPSVYSSHSFLLSLVLTESSIKKYYVNNDFLAAKIFYQALGMLGFAEEAEREQAACCTYFVLSFHKQRKNGRLVLRLVLYKVS